jgi:hypothetical protein
LLTFWSATIAMTHYDEAFARQYARNHQRKPRGAPSPGS